MKLSKLFIFILVSAFLVFGVLGIQDTQAGPTDNVSGWAYSENIGYISMNSENIGDGHWVLVDDDPFQPHDGLGSYVYTDSATEQKDAYEVESPPEGLATPIWNIMLYFHTQGQDWSYLRLNGMEDYSGLHHCTDDGGASWSNIGVGFGKRPDGEDWTWDDIKNVQIVTGLATCGSTQGRLTQAYIEVFYGYSGESVTLAINGDGDYTQIEQPVTSPGVNYGVDINETTGLFSGYAWSENIGYISFEQTDLVGCPTTPCEARLDLDTYNVSGWARATAPIGEPDSKTGGWDGWISLSGSYGGGNYGVSYNSATNEFEGWAWGGNETNGDAANKSVIGWVSWNDNSDGAVGPTDYQVIADLSINTPPEVESSQIDYQAYCTAAPGEGQVGFSWVYNDDDGHPQSSFDFMVNNVNNVNDPSPEVDRSVNGSGSGQSVVVSTTGALDTINYNTTYYWWVRVYDSEGANSGWVAGTPSSFTTTLHRWPFPQFTYSPDSPTMGEMVNFTDDSFEYGSNINYEWDFDYIDPDFTVDSTVIGDNTHIYNTFGSYTVKLRITDLDIGPSAYCTSLGQIITVGERLPDWREIPPFLWLKHLLVKLLELFRF